MSLHLPLESIFIVLKAASIEISAGKCVKVNMISVLYNIKTACSASRAKPEAIRVQSVRNVASDVHFGPGLMNYHGPDNQFYMLFILISNCMFLKMDLIVDNRF